MTDIAHHTATSDDGDVAISCSIDEAAASTLSPSPSSSVFVNVPVMGTHGTMASFLEATGVPLGSDGTHPWTQGSPLAAQIPNGPNLDFEIKFTYADLKYPNISGELSLRNAIKDYYNHFYGSKIDTDNVTVFPGGRPALYSTLALLRKELHILVEETEYTPYWDLLNLMQKLHRIVPSNPENSFRPTIEDYIATAAGGRRGGEEENSVDYFVLKSNPCNPTGVVTRGDALQSLVDFCCSKPGCGGLFDEAYEFMASPPVSAMQHIPDINDTNLFVVSGATKGLQSPGLRIGWVISSKANAVLFRNFSCSGIGSTSSMNQLCCAKLLDLPRVTSARDALSVYYASQRDKYAKALTDLGFKLYTGDGAFYHWVQLPNGLTASEFNERLFTCKAAILPGMFCDMHRRGEDGPHSRFIRLSFGPLLPDALTGDIEVLRKCIGPPAASLDNSNNNNSSSSNSNSNSSSN